MSWSKAETRKRLPRPFGRAAHAGAVLATSALALCIGVRGTQDAVANGDTRTITIKHMHTKEETTVTFKRDGRYDSAALEKLNWAMRDWRIDEPIRMDPRLFDLAWEVHRKVGSEQPFHVVSAYRSPGTNSMLRRRSRGVAKHSQHTLGKAMDFYLPDTPTAKIREVGMRLQRGGVGFYPGAHTPFVHLDAGSVRSWPRMTRSQLVRLFPDEKTVHLPADGKPLSGYEVARAEIMSGGGSVMGYAATDFDEGAIIASGGGKGFWAALFGGDDEEADARPARGRAAARRAPKPQPTVMAYAGDSNSGDGGRFAVFNQPDQPEATGRTLLRERSNRATTTAPAAPAAAPAPAETQVAALAPQPAEPQKPSPISTAFPVARPDSLTPPPVAPAGSTQLAALAAEAAAVPLPATEQKLILASLPPRRPGDLPAPAIENLVAGRPVAAPLPPTRPVILASLAPEALRLETETQSAAIPAGARLVDVAHPSPPIRPRAPGEPQRRAVDVAATEARTPIAAEYDADRAGLDTLFAAVAQPSAPARRTGVATAKARVTDLQSKGWVAGPSPAAALGFTAAPNDLKTSSFSGPAVRALPTTFVQN